MKNHGTQVEKYVVKKKHVANNKSIGKSGHIKGKQQSVMNERFK